MNAVSSRPLQFAAVAIVFVFAMNSLPQVDGAGNLNQIATDCATNLNLQRCQRSVGGPGGGGGTSSSTTTTTSPPPQQPSYAPKAEPDLDGDRMGDEFTREWSQRLNQLVKPLVDLDGDDLYNVDEFRWGLVPACLPPGFRNCVDHEQVPSTGIGGDNWPDGPEVFYWNNPDNDSPVPNDPTDPVPEVKAVAITDPDRNLDSDHDGLLNVDDPDSDNDGLRDGDEHRTYSSYPELADSDCAITAVACTPSSSTTYHAPREGNPGTGDGLNDSAELDAWSKLGPSAWQVDADGDGIPSNLLDPDSDNDGLLDGQEFLLGQGQVRPDRHDTDGDGLPDGDHDGLPGNEEVAWNEDTDLDGRLNANDRDSDNDGMPDGWENRHGLNMLDPSDALIDRDGDLLSSLAEYGESTDPNNPDTEGDLLFDGDEVARQTDPLHWDTDRDGLPDRIEVLHGLNPRSSSDAGQDKDGDSYREIAWTNLAEYRHGRPAGYDEATQGPYLGGTKPDNPDSDADGAPDGYEVYYGSSPGTPADGDLDQDNDGLSYAQEVAAGTDPDDADTDGDGLCDGSRGSACLHPVVNSFGFQPGEQDYGSSPRDADSDDDGLRDDQEVTRWDPQATGKDRDVDNDLKGGVTDPDSDNDRLNDGIEVSPWGTDPAAADTDGDRLNDGREILDHGTLPLNPHSDNDGLVDGDEVDIHRTNPRQRDTDGDTLSDGDEVQVHLTDPLKKDTDDDGVPDGWEVGHRTQPRTDDSDLDPDSDALPNLGEYQYRVDAQDPDTDGDHLPDGWEAAAGLDPASPLQAFDLDGDDLGNIDEFRWRLVPLCLPALLNCFDHERSPTTGAGGDNWRDGDEVAYWNDPSNDGAVAVQLEHVLEDPDARRDNDGDGLRDLDDTDSDNDGILDGNEMGHGTYPELADSDCSIAALQCTPSWQTTNRLDPRLGSPGTRDGLNDGAELAAWKSLGSFHAQIDFDGDGIPSNLLDPDSDNDGLLDGQEFLLGRGQVRPDDRDTDNDGLPDGDHDRLPGGEEVAWNEDTDLDGRLNANDPDSDNDGMPDKWEVDNRLVMVDPSDALTDRDGDALSNLGEYQAGTDPNNPDTEGDFLLDGDEVARGTDPLFWDTDRDGLPDRIEVLYDLNPLDPTDASEDPDGDSYASVAWTNLNEYRYARPTGYNEASQGPHLRGTDPTLADSDGDLASDGYEVFVGTNPKMPLDGDADQDDDGLSYTQEQAIDTDPEDPDTDGDGLCDGGRGAACVFPFGDGSGFQPGEQDYASDPRDADSDNDLLTDGREANIWDSQATGQDRDVDNDLAGGVTDWDNDGDGLGDGDEFFGGLSDPADQDSDDDRLNDGREVLDYGTTVNDPDTDDDALLDGDEVDLHFTNPRQPDTDGDGLEDGAELQVHLTDPLKKDTEADGMPDGWEVDNGLQPRANDAAVDPDADTLPNLGEYQYLVDPNDPDTDRDHLPDGWEAAAGLDPASPLDQAIDFDADNLGNVDEFRWRLVPACVVVLNCYDHERDPLTGGGGDSWSDGAEVAYWNDPSNDGVVVLELEHLLEDPDARRDNDGDGLRDLDDEDSDNDGLPDGEEFWFGTYPELLDSDCLVVAVDCTASWEVSNRLDPRLGSPGSKDGLTDLEELEAWGKLHWFYHQVDFDGDGIPSNLLDPDSDNDGLLDGQEFLLHRTRPDRPDTDNDGLTDFEEVSQTGTDPLKTDTDSDGMPDGWEAAYGLNPRVNDAALDADQDAYSLAEPWQNLQEYQYKRPGGWNEAVSGVWWGGTEPMTPDTDADGVLDGVEVHYGSDASDGTSTDPRGYGEGSGPVATPNPLNEDLSEEEMEPADLAYLKGNQARAAETGKELAQVADQLLSAAVSGNVTQALNVIYNATPVGPPARNVAQLVKLSQEAVTNLVKCAPVSTTGAPQADETVQEAVRAIQDVPSLLDSTSSVQAGSSQTWLPSPTLDSAGFLLPDRIEEIAGPTSSTETAEASDSLAPSSPVQGTMESTIEEADEAAGCMVEAIVPFVDALINRTVEPLPVVGDLVAQTRNETLPAIIATADRILPIEVQATQEALLQRPLGTLASTALGLPAYATDPKNLQELVANASATASMVVNSIVKPTNRHPQFLHDVAANNGLIAQWEQVVAFNRQLNEASGGQADAVSAVDSLSFNLYTNRGGTERIMAAVPGQRTCVRLDASMATRDASGCDLYVTASLSTSASLPLPAANAGTRLVPTMLVEKAVPTASINVVALGYFQLPASPFIAVVGFDPPGSNIPAKVEATLRSFSTDSSEDRSLSAAFTHSATSVRMEFIVAAYKVDENQVNKPVVPGHEAILRVYSDETPSLLALDLSSTAQRDPVGALTTLSAEASAAAAVEADFAETMGQWSAKAALSADLPAGASRLQARFGPQDALSWTWKAPALTPGVDFGYEGQATGGKARALQINATNLGDTVSVLADPGLHRYTVEAGNGPTKLSFLHGHGAKGCLKDTAGTRSFVYDAGTGYSCTSGVLDKVQKMTAESGGSLAHATATSRIDSSSFSIRIRDSNPIWALVNGALSWDSRLALAENVTQAWSWSAGAVASEVRFEAVVDHGAWKNTMALHAHSVSRWANATVDLRTGQAVLDASGYIGDATLALTNTGSAPSAGGEHVRLLSLGESAGRLAESSWKLAQARSLSTRLLPNGTVQVSGDVTGSHAINAVFRDDEHHVVLNVSAVSGKFNYWILEDPSAGGITFKQAAPAATGTVELFGTLPKGRLEATLTGAPARFTLAGTLADQTVTVDASAAIGSLRFGYGLGGVRPTAPASANALAMQLLGPEQGGFHLTASSVRSLSAHHEPGRVTFASTFTAAAPLALRFQDSQEDVLLNATAPPSQATVTHAPGSFTWSGTAPTTFTFKAAAAGPRYLSVEADSAPSSLSSSWTSSYGDTFDGMVTHSGASPLARLVLAETMSFQDPAGSNLHRGGWKVAGLQLPARVQVHAVPQEAVLDVRATTAANTAATAGRLTASYAYDAASLPALPAGTQGAVLQQAGTSSMAALSFEGLRSLALRLAGQGVNATEPSVVELDRAGRGDVAFQATSERTGIDAGIRIMDAAPRVDLTVDGGGASHDLHIVWLAPSDSGPASMRLVSPGQDIGFFIDVTPASFQVDWTPQTPFALLTSRAFSPSVQFAETLGAAPWVEGKDFAAIQLGSAGSAPPRVGLHLTGTTGFLLDAAGRHLAASDDGSSRAFVADYREPNLGFQAMASDLPSSTSLSWNPVERDFQYTGSQGVQALQVSHYPASDKSPRMFFALQDSAAGATTFDQDVETGSFAMSRPAAPGRVRISLDNGGVGLLQTLNEEGLFLDIADPAKVFLVDLHGVQSAVGTMEPNTAPQVTLSGDGGPGLRLRMNNAAQRITGTLDSRNPGVTSLSWPNPDRTESFRFDASGVSGRTAWLATTVGAESIQARLTSSPSSWSLASEQGRTFEYEATGSSAGTLTASGAWHDVTFDATVQQPPSQLTVLPAETFASGSIQATGGTPARFRLALTSPAGSGLGVSARVAGGEVLSVDSAGDGGSIYVNLPGPVRIDWDMARPGVDTSAVAAELNMAGAVAAPVLLQFVDADQQTAYRLGQGIPAVARLALQAGASDWSLHAETGGKSVRVQQQAPQGTLDVSAWQPPSTLDVTARPSGTDPIEVIGSGPSGLITAASQWQGSGLRFRLEQAPSRFKAETDGLTPSAGTMGTQGTGSVGLAEVLVIPGGTTANRFESVSNYLAVATTGNTPYVALKAHGLKEAAWAIPEAGESSNMEAGLNRMSAVSGVTSLVLEGPGQDMTAKVLDSAPAVRVGAERTPASIAAPVALEFESTGGSTGKADITHVSGDTQAVVSSSMSSVEGTARVTATGAEPASIKLEADKELTAFNYETTHQDTLLSIVSQKTPPKLEAQVQRGTCGATSPAQVVLTTHGTGTTGPILVQIGDHSTVPADRSGNYVDVRCDGGNVGVGMKLPFVQDLAVMPGPCGGFRVQGIPANTPTPLLFADARGLYEVRAATTDVAGGFLDLDLDCEKAMYDFRSSFGGPARLSELELGYTRLEVLSEATGQCIKFQNRCMLSLSIVGSSMPSTATALFSGPNGWPGFQLSGDEGGTLDVRILLEKAPKEPLEKLAVTNTMRLQQLKFLKTDQAEFAQVEGAAPNQILRRNSPDQDTLYVKLDRPNSLGFSVENRTGFFELNMDYQGSSGQAFDFYGIDEKCVQQRATVSNLPSALNLHILLNGPRKYVESTASSSRIDSLRAAMRLGAECADRNKGLDVFTSLTGLPAGPWHAGVRFGAAGFLKVKSDGGFIDGVDVGVAEPGNAERYVSLHLNNARLALEWDLDGASEYSNNPYFVYCDTGGSQSEWTMRVRFGGFGLGIGFDGDPGLRIGCDELQVRWHYNVLGACGINACVLVPSFKVNGKLTLSVQGSVPVTEVLYGDRWWHISNKILTT